MQRRETILIAALVAVLVLVCVGAALSPMIAESYEKPDPARMRAYRMSLLTDAQVLELHARAVAESAKQKKIADERDREYWAERNQANADCEASPAAKLRDPDHCNRPIPLGMMDGGNQALVEPPNSLFEDYVMGICAMVHSVREARQYRCLP
jgi:hypothetical protein